MKIGLLTDPHYSSAELTCGRRYNSRSLEKIKKAFAHFAAENCEMVIMLGDETDREPTHEQEADNLCKIAEVIEYHGIETICLMGNHDAAVLETEHFYDCVGQQHRPRLITRGGVNLLFLDACYLHTGEHYSPRIFCDWTDTFNPHTEQLRETLAALTGNTYVFMHQNIDPNVRADHRLSNDEEIRRILEESGKVRAVYQGHYHPGCRSEHHGICYITLPAMCENEDAFETAELL